MAFLNLSLYGHPSGASFDPEVVLRKVRAAFPEATFIPGDRAAAEVESAKKILARDLQENPEGPARTVVESLRRKALAYGPAYAFQIPYEGGKPIQGLARRVNVQFLFDESLPEMMRHRL